MTSSLKRTPLYSAHIDLGAKIVPFAGWEMPVQYSTGIKAEHMAVREKVGIFDVSHMGEIYVRGSQSLDLLDHLLVNNPAKLKPGRAQYTALCNARGGIIDDLIIYMIADNDYLLCVNASNADKDFDWINSNNSFEAQVINKSSEIAQVAVQGPLAWDLVDEIFETEYQSTLKRFSVVELERDSVKFTIARTGYTGEDGCEIFMPNSAAVDFWNVLIERGASYGALPVGLGARDSLRLEAFYPLHGHELSEDITAIESGIGWIVKHKDRSFIGRDILAAQEKDGAPRALMGFEVVGKGIARENVELFTDSNLSGASVGLVTSGTHTPYLDRPIGMALVSSDLAEASKTLYANVRSRPVEIKLISIPHFHFKKDKNV